MDTNDPKTNIFTPADNVHAPIGEEVHSELVARGTVPPRAGNMTASTYALHAENTEILATPSRSLWYYSWRRLKRNRLAMAGLILTITMIVIAILAGVLAPFDPNQQILEYSTKPIGFQGNILLMKNEVDAKQTIPIPISKFERTGDAVRYTDEDHPGQWLRTIPVTKLVGTSESDWHKEPRFYLGTDRYGRDVLSRLMYGARVSLTVALFSELLSIFIGIVLGAIAGFYRGWVDDVLMWFTTVVWSIPALLLVIALSIALGLGLWQTIVAIGITGWPDMARIVRGQFFSLRETEYVEATKALGLSNMRTIFRHILPNSIGPIIVIATAGFASAIVYEASLSFLGLGVQPPTSTWGQMIHDGFGYIAAGSNWGLTIFPSLAIMLAVFAFNLFGDGLRDAFDPKLKR
jgi:peptide/nickel transport system permease protein